MGPLIDIWLEKGWLPRPTSSGGASVGSASVSRVGSIAESSNPAMAGGQASQVPTGLGVSPI